MKRFFGVTTAAALLAGVAMSHSVLSAPPADQAGKTLVCRVAGQPASGGNGQGAAKARKGVVVPVANRNVDKALARGRACVIDALTADNRSLIGKACDTTAGEGGKCANPPAAQ